MLEHLAKTLVQLVITALGVVTLVFFTLRLIPGDAASAMAGDTLSGEALQRLRAQMGLDQPMLVQYVTYLKNLAGPEFRRDGDHGPVDRRVDQDSAADHGFDRGRHPAGDGDDGHTARHAGRADGPQGP